MWLLSLGGNLVRGSTCGWLSDARTRVPAIEEAPIRVGLLLHRTEGRSPQRNALGERTITGGVALSPIAPRYRTASLFTKSAVSCRSRHTCATRPSFGGFTFELTRRLHVRPRTERHGRPWGIRVEPGLSPCVELERPPRPSEACQPPFERNVPIITTTCADLGQRSVPSGIGRVRARTPTGRSNTFGIVATVFGVLVVVQVPSGAVDAVGDAPSRTTAAAIATPAPRPRSPGDDARQGEFGFREAQVRGMRCVSRPRCSAHYSPVNFRPGDFS